MTSCYKLITTLTAVVLSLMILGGCGSNSTKIDITMKRINTCDELKYLDPLSFAEITGQLVQEPFVNKAGKANYNIMEWYLILSDGCRIYLKNYHPHKEAMETLKDRQVIMSGMIRYGQVDSDDPNVQSRIGHMLSVQSVRAK